MQTDPSVASTGSKDQGPFFISKPTFVYNGSIVACCALAKWAFCGLWCTQKNDGKESFSIGHGQGTLPRRFTEGVGVMLCCDE